MSIRASTGLRRERLAGLTVAALASSLGVALIQATGVLQTAVSSDGVTGNSRTVADLLQLTAPIFLALALYAGAVVTTNTVATVVAGRTRQIALRRLLGASARSERRAIALEGLQAGAIGGVLGLVAGTGATALLTLACRLVGALPDLGYSFLRPGAVLPALAVVPTTWLAAHVGARRVLDVTPVQALGRAEEPSEAEARSGRARSALAVLLVAAGSVLLLAGVVIGLEEAGGFVISFLGGLASFTGLVLGAADLIPRALRLSAPLLGTSPPARLATSNASRYPLRSTRSTLGLLIAVTLISTLGSGLATLAGMLRAAEESGAQRYDGIDTSLTSLVAICSALTGLSAVIAAAGLVTALSLGMVSRTRELGLLRALGFRSRQLRRLVLAESAQLVLTAVVLGLALGLVYGWAGAHSLLGAQPHVPGLAFVRVPWRTFGGMLVGGILLTGLAAVIPSRGATRVEPVEALAVD